MPVIDLQTLKHLCIPHCSDMDYTEFYIINTQTNGPTMTSQYKCFSKTLAICILILGSSAYEANAGAIENAGQKMEHVAEKAGNGIKKGAEKVGSGIEKGAHYAGKGIQKGAYHTEKGIRKGMEKTGEGLEKAGEKIQQVAGKA